jgi:hypothetical protein
MKPADELVAAMVACLTDDLHELFQERAARSRLIRNSLSD